MDIEGSGGGRARVARAGSDVLRGATCTLVAYMVFSLHDASVKLLVADLPVWQVLFARSAVIVPLCLAVGGRRALLEVARSPVRGRLVFRSLVYGAGWIAYYLAARDLQLAELETIYYASPLMVVGLALVVLRERPPPASWASLAIGFAGVLVACQPGGPRAAGPVLLALLAAALWAYTIVLIRQLARDVSVIAQMLVSNAVFLAFCALALPSTWHAVGPGEAALLALCGVGGALGQYLTYEGLRLAPASLLAPLEYTGLLWSFLLTRLVWGETPAPAVFVGAGLILVAGAVTLARAVPADA